MTAHTLLGHLGAAGQNYANEHMRRAAPSADEQRWIDNVSGTLGDLAQKQKREIPAQLDALLAAQNSLAKALNELQERMTPVLVPPLGPDSGQIGNTPKPAIGSDLGATLAEAAERANATTDVVLALLRRLAI